MWACKAVLAMALALSAATALAEPLNTSPPPNDGEALTIAKCSTCHGFGRVLMYKRTRAQWLGTVDLMKEKGFEASDSEVQAIVDYLTTALPPDVEEDVTPAPSAAP